MEHQTQTESYTFQNFNGEYYVSTFDRITLTEDGEQYEWEERYLCNNSTEPYDIDDIDPCPYEHGF